MIIRLATFLLAACSVLAADLVQPQNPPADPDGPYVQVNLAPVANAMSPLAEPWTLVSIQKIPLQLSQTESANHLFMQPIGWSAAETESRKEYPGYYAKFDHLPAAGDTSRAVLRIPIHDYVCAYVLAATDDDPALTTSLALRFGLMGGSQRTQYQDFTATIPRAGDTTVRKGRDGVVQTIPGERGNLYLVRIPINRVMAQDLDGHWGMYLDLTRPLRTAINLPDPNRFQLRPLDDPSGVRIYALTLERASMEVDLQPAQPGGVFNQPELPAFNLAVQYHYPERQTTQVIAEVTRDDGQIWTFSFEPFASVARQKVRDTLKLELTERGHYRVNFRFMRKEQVYLERPTTFAILAPDTRQHRATSPFGTWDFGGGHSSLYDSAIAVPLAVKAGLRYAREDREHGLESYRDGKLTPKSLPGLLKQKEEVPDFVPPKRGLIFHENSVSGPHVLRTPDVFTGKTYTLTENDRKRFDALWTEAIETYKLMGEHFPQTEIYFGNGMPHLIEEFCRQGIPREYLKVAGNESGNFMRPPETQPTDFVANNAGIFMFRTVLDKYGYQDTKVYQCFEMCYPNTNPGNLTTRTQAEYFVRHAMHSLAWRIPLIRMGLLTDVGNSYYHSNWGASGFCYGTPHVSPKGSYVAVATMTLMLDGATFSRLVPTGSDSLYAMEFAGPESVVTCLWTTRGERPVTVTMPETPAPVLVNLYGRETVLAVADGRASFTAGTGAVYLRTRRPIEIVSLGAPVHQPPPAGESFVISKLDTLAGWTVEMGRNYELESYNFMNQRRLGDFAWTELPELAGRERVIQVTPKLPCPGSEYLQMYSVLRLDQPVEIPGYPTEIGLWVHGNSTWGRVIFELEDAGGQRWISLGAEQGGEPNPWMADWLPKEEFEKLQSSGKAGISDWNADDAWGRSVLNHDGWRYVKFPLPGQFGRNRDIYHWPYTSQWRFSGNSKVKYPLTFKRLILTLPEKILYANDWRPVAKPQVALSTLQVTYVPAEEAFAGE